ncbi:MAG: hypothetical protein RR058_05665 [Oscillospiraceae bacterium]
MYTLAILLLVAYYIFTNITSLVQHEGPFTAVHYILMFITLLMAVVGVFMGNRYFHDFKEKKEKQAKERAEAEKKRKQELLADFLPSGDEELDEVSEVTPACEPAKADTPENGTENIYNS